MSPTWLAQIAEAVSGQVLNKFNVLEPTAPDRAGTVNRIRDELNQSTSNDDWTTWGRWFLGEPSTRTISPFSKVTMSEYIERRMQENTPESLVEASQLAFGNAELSQIVTTNSDLKKSAFKNAFMAAPGSSFTLYGSNFTREYNAVQLTSATSNADFYDIPELSSTNGTSITFTIPSNAPPGAYWIKAGAFNSPWSKAEPFIIITAPPSVVQPSASVSRPDAKAANKSESPSTVTKKVPPP